MTVTFEELMQPITAEEFLESEISVAADIGLPTTAWQELSVVREMLYVDAHSCAQVSSSTNPTVRGGLLDWAEGPWLTLLADQVYDVQRIVSDFASGTMTLGDTTGAPYSFDPGDIRVLNEDTDTTHTNTTGGTIPANGTVSVTMLADSPGTESNVTSASTLSLITSLPGRTVAYLTDLIGQDEELDPALRQRCRDSLGRASPNGPAAAYDYFAKSAVRSDGTTIGVTRTRRVESNGTVTLYVADADGVVISTDVDFILAAINLNCVPTGFTALVYSATLLPVALAMTLTRDPNSTESDAAVEARITAAIIELFSIVPVGGKDSDSFKGVRISTLITTVRVAGGSAITDVVFSAPSSDIALALNEVPSVDGSISYLWES